MAPFPADENSFQLCEDPVGQLLCLSPAIARSYSPPPCLLAFLALFHPHQLFYLIPTSGSCTAVLSSFLPSYHRSPSLIFFRHLLKSHLQMRLHKPPACLDYSWTHSPDSLLFAAVLDLQHSVLPFDSCLSPTTRK